MDWTRREREELRRELSGRLRGEVRFADTDRALYSCDASIYQVLPLGVVLPADQEDAQEAIRICLQAGAPVLPRGAGTSLAGQAVGRAVVVDLSRHLNRIVALDPVNRRAVVEPGVVQSQLNKAAAPHRLMFGPDTASASRATLGGMLGNNSSGAHSILYGKMVDHVRRVDTVVSDGSRIRLEEIAVPDRDSLRDRDDILGRVLRFAIRVREDLGDEITRRFPDVLRRVGGYNLDELLEGDRINLARLLVGSEGSLATALELEVDLVEAPATTGLALVHFEDLDPAVASTPALLQTGPSAVELMDDLLLKLARDNPAWRQKLWFADEATRSVQMVEYFASDPKELEEKLRRLREVVSGLPGALGMVVAETPRQLADAWAVRKAGEPLLSSIATRRKPLPFVEDTAVPPERLAEYVRRFKIIMEEHGTEAAYYAHASAGCLHIRPLLDLHDRADRRRLVSISEAIFALVQELGGSMSGEHGDGRSRSHYNERAFGPVIYRAFQELKAAFDPGNLMNPGQVVNGPPMGEDLRADFTDHLQTPGTLQSWPHGIQEALEACNGTASCRSLEDVAAMCPSFQATQLEEHSTRGRASLLRAALSGAMPAEELFGETLAGAMELCLMCKACKSECPVQVDMSKLKAEWLWWRNREQGTPLRSRVFSRTRQLLEWGSRMPRIFNALVSNRLGRKAAELTMGLDSRRPLPQVAEQCFFHLHHPQEKPGRKFPNGEVLLYLDTFTIHQWPRAGLDAVELLEAAGHRVLVPELGCCGRPAVGQGELDHGRNLGRRLLESLAPYARRGVPIVGLEPGCLSMLWDDYRSLLPGEDSELVSRGTFLLEEHLVSLHESGKLEITWKPIGARLAVHPHCHQRSLGKHDATVRALSLIPELEVVALGGGCCGMAGDFGHLHYDVSTAVWERTAAFRDPGPFCVPGSSCRKQFLDRGRTAFAPATLLAMSLRGTPLES